jgi:hypothetical protein
MEEDVKNSGIGAIKDSNLSPEQKAKLTRELFEAMEAENSNKGHGLEKLNLFYDYLKSFFLPIYGFVIGIKKITDDEDYLNGFICIALNIIEIILIVYSLAGLFSIGKTNNNPYSLGNITKNYVNSYKAVNTPIK